VGIIVEIPKIITTVVDGAKIAFEIFINSVRIKWAEVQNLNPFVSNKTRFDNDVIVRGLKEQNAELIKKEILLGKNLLAEMSSKFAILSTDDYLKKINGDLKLRNNLDEQDIELTDKQKKAVEEMQTAVESIAKSLETLVPASNDTVKEFDKLLGVAKTV